MRFVDYLLIFNSESPKYLNEIYFSAEASSFQRLKQPLRKF